MDAWTRERLDEALKVQGEPPLTNSQVADLERRFPHINELDQTALRDLADDVRDWRPFYDGTRHRRGRTGDEPPRTTTPGAESKLAGKAWQTYYSQHVERVLGAFEDDRRVLRDALGLTEALDPENVVGWLALYVAAHPGSRGYEALSLRGPMGEGPMPFAAECLELRELRDGARRFADCIGCSEAEAVDWLLADVAPPARPLLSVTSYRALLEEIEGADGEVSLGHVARRYVITVNSGLVSADEVASLYRRARNRDYVLPIEANERQIVFTAELLRFVRAQRRQVAPGQRLPQWKALVALWNERYPQHPFKSWRAMQSSHRQASARAETKKRK